MGFFDFREGFNTDFIFGKLATDSQIGWKKGGWHPCFFYAGTRNQNRDAILTLKKDQVKGKLVI